MLVKSEFIHANSFPHIMAYHLRIYSNHLPPHPLYIIPPLCQSISLLTDNCFYLCFAPIETHLANIAWHSILYSLIHSFIHPFIHMSNAQNPII